MNKYKSLDYLQEIKKTALLNNKELTSVLEYVSYILQDNDYTSARNFIDDIIELIDNEEIEL